MPRHLNPPLILLSLAVLLIALPGCPPSARWVLELPDAKLYWYSISGSSADNIYAVGSTQANTALSYRFDGDAWIPVNTGAVNNLEGVAVQSPTNVYVTEDLVKVWRYQVIGGVASWAALPPSPDAPMKRYYAPVWMNSTSRLFTVGDAPPTPVGGVPPNNRFYIFNGSVWTQALIASSLDLYGLGGNSDSNVFAVGDSGLIAHYDGANTSIMPSGTMKYLAGVWVASATRAYIVGEDGIALRYDGQDWTAMDSGVTSDLYAVWGAGANDVFAVGEGGTILHYDGRSWKKQDSGVNTDVNSVWGTSSNNVYAATDGTILHYRRG